MSGEHGRWRGWLLPVIVVAVGAYFLVGAAQRGMLNTVALKPVNRVGLGAMLAGLAVVLMSRRHALWKLAGTLLCGVGAILVICL